LPCYPCSQPICSHGHATQQPEQSILQNARHRGSLMSRYTWCSHAWLKSLWLMCCIAAFLLAQDREADARSGDKSFTYRMPRSTASFLMCCVAVRHLSGTEDLMLDLKTKNPAAHAPSSNCGVELSQGLSKGKGLGRNSWLLEDGTADVMHLATWRPCSARLNACVSLVLHFTALQSALLCCG